MVNDNDSNKLEILEVNYWEHFKLAKDLSLFLPLKHPKRVILESEMNKMIEQIHKLKPKIDNSNE